jgi:hypothetical protein
MRSLGRVDFRRGLELALLHSFPQALVNQASMSEQVFLL